MLENRSVLQQIWSRGVKRRDRQQNNLKREKRERGETGSRTTINIKAACGCSEEEREREAYLSMAEKTEREKRWSLHGATALVTGGSKGIGQAIVEELAGLGAKVHTCARNQAELDKSLQHWHSLKLDVTASISDVSSRADREKLIETVSSLFQGKLNILINNVGTMRMKTALESSLEDYSFMMATNLESAIHLSQLSHPLLKASGAGKIVFISSIAGLRAAPLVTIYSLTKGAINQLTQNLAFEWAKDNTSELIASPQDQLKLHC